MCHCPARYDPKWQAVSAQAQAQAQALPPVRVVSSLSQCHPLPLRDHPLPLRDHHRPSFCLPFPHRPRNYCVRWAPTTSSWHSPSLRRHHRCPAALLLVDLPLSSSLLPLAPDAPPTAEAGWRLSSSRTLLNTTNEQLYDTFSVYCNKTSSQFNCRV
jgi:hypothetical protein